MAYAIETANLLKKLLAGLILAPIILISTPIWTVIAIIVSLQWAMEQFQYKDAPTWRQVWKEIF
jgi:hypothetical protein